MKILITFYDLNDLGGIINNQEGLYAGLRELGHDVQVRELHWKDRIGSTSSADTSRKVLGEMGLKYDQRGGWYWPPSHRFAYRGKHNLMRWKQFASGFDLIIWQIPVPTKQKSNFGNLDWLELYNVPVKQIAYVHDGNFRQSSPHLYAIMRHLTGVTGVHPCAYHSLSCVPVPRAMTLSSQMRIADRILAADECKESRQGFLSLQTFKAWKRVQDIVRAVPHMGDYPKRVAGGGIQWHYMTSATKCKDEYRVLQKYDPECLEGDVGRPIWDVAIECGMEYLGYISNEERERQLHRSRVLIDSSWSRRYAEQGDHFNRVVIDGIIGGCAPVARPLGIAHDVGGFGEVFRPGISYLSIPHDATPKEFAERLDVYVSDEGILRPMVEHCREEIVPHFDYRRVAQSFVDLAEGRPAGFYSYARGVTENPVGVADPEMQRRCDKLMNGFFAGREAEDTSDNEEAVG